MVQQTRTAGQAAARVDGKSPDVPVAAGHKGFKAELDELRERMRGLGFPYDEIAAEIGRRYRVRPREAYRLAWGWTLEQAAARFNDRAARHGADPEARASLTGSRLCEYEKWPRTTRRPSVYVLVMLAEMYETDVLCLLDLADHESLPQQDRLVLMRRPRAEIVTPDDDEPAPPGDPRGQVADMQVAMAGGLSLSLPYVPARLVIEVSGPAAGTGQLTEAGERVTGHLALVRGMGGSGNGGTEVTGA